MNRKYFYRLLCGIVGISQCVVNCQEPSPTVQTRYGTVEGTSDGTSREGRKFYQFRGIQYALVPERFEPAVEPAAWNGTKPAKEFGLVCYDVQAHGDENCLFLNIFTPQLGLQNGTLLNVAVYIHGGSFQGGASDNYGPNYLMDEDVVFVTINYRLGILGFLSTEDANSPGNYGLKDQVMALRWIRDNIAGFGGDKDKITIMGQSAGSASVTYHLLSPMSRGLFRHAIAQSGSFLDPWAFTRKPFRYAKKVAELLNCPDTNSSAAIVACLKAVPANAIAERALSRNATLKFFEDPIAGFGPTIEPIIGDGVNTFLSASPYELLMSGNVTKVPLLAGLVKEEGIYLWAAYLLHSNADYAVTDRLNLQENWNSLAPSAFYFDEKAPQERLDEIAQKLQDFYFQGRFSLDDNSTLLQLSHLYSDRLFVASVARFINLYSKHSSVYPYLYTFNRYVGIEFGWEELHKNYSLDATHAADLDMMMSPLFRRVRDTPDHNEISKSITKLWASFIKNGTPTATYGSELKFPPVDSTEGLKKWYRLDMDTELSDNIFADRIAFWDSLQLSDDDFINCYC